MDPFSRRIKILSTLPLFLLPLLLTHCGSAGSPTTTSSGSGGSGTSDLTLKVTNSAASLSLEPPSSGKGLQLSVAKSATVTSGSVRCVAIDSDGKKTVKTGSLGSNGEATCSRIPSGQEVLVYLLDANGNVLATSAVSDSKAVGGARDGFKVDANKTISANLTYNSTTSAATSDCATSDCKPPASKGSTDIDLSGTWKMTCNGVKRIDNDQLDTSQSCSSDLNNKNVFLHRVEATDADSVTRFGYGAWPSQAAFTACGSTEGLDNVPAGWSLSTSGQTAAFGWGAPFNTFSASSTSDQIATMIKNVTTAHGVSQSFSTYQTANCSGVTANQCAGQFYWAVVEAAIQSNPALACWPKFKMAWSQSGITFSPDTSLGGKTAPLNRYDFMSTHKIGDQTYMKSFESFTYNAYNFTSNTSVECLVQSDLLISFATPSAAPVAGTTSNVHFMLNEKVTSTGGTAANNTLCQQQGGSNATFSSNGTYVDVTMTKQ